MPIVCRILSASPSVTAFAPMGTMTRMPFQLRLAKDRPVDREVLAPTVQPKRQKKTTKQTAPYTASSTRVTSGAKPETASKGSKPRTIKNITLSLELDAYFKSKLTEMHERNSQGMNLTRKLHDYSWQQYSQTCFAFQNFLILSSFVSIFYMNLI
jgi:hypothetical protein